MRILLLTLALIVVALQYRLWVSDSGMREVWRLRREVTAQTEQNQALKDRNRTLAAEVQDLKKGKSAIEERARTDLGMVGPGETFFQVAPAATSNSKSTVLSADASAAHDASSPQLAHSNKPASQNNSALNGAANAQPGLSVSASH